MVATASSSCFLGSSEASSALLLRDLAVALVQDTTIQVVFTGIAVTAARVGVRPLARVSRSVWQLVRRAVARRAERVAEDL